MVLAGIAGKLGAGKTITLTRECYWFYRAGYTIYTSYGLNKIPHTRIEDKEEIIEIGLEHPDQRKFFALDEGYLLFDALTKSATEQQFNRNLINITRKMKMVVYFSTQTLGQINLRTRVLFDFLMLPRYYPRKRRLKIDYFLATLHGDYMHLKTKKYRNMHQYYQFFNTYEVMVEFLKDNDSTTKTYPKGKGKVRKEKKYNVIPPDQTNLEYFEQLVAKAQA